MVTPRYLPHIGGVELHVEQVARRLAERDIDVTVLATDPSRTLPPLEEVDGVRIRRVPAWPKRRDYYLALGVYAEIAGGRWDIVHVQSYHTVVAPLAMLAARRSRIPYVVTFHGGGHSSAFRRRLRPMQLSLLRPLLARAGLLVALTPFEVEHYSKVLRLPRERFVIVPNGSDLPRPAGPVPSRDPALIASLGRLERYKGHHRVIAALPHVLRARPDARLWLAGTGPYEADLRKLADRLDVSRRVEIRAVPIEDRAALAARLSRVSVAVSLSEFETQPIGVLEAIALGCHTVVADAPGLRQLAAAGLTRAVAIDSRPEVIAAAILDELGRPPVDEPLVLPTWDECAERLAQVYESVADPVMAAA